MTPHLPTEVLVAIAEVRGIHQKDDIWTDHQVTRRKDLVTLRRVSMRLNAIVTPVLFASLHLGRITDDMWDGFTDEAQPLHIFEHVKHLEFHHHIREDPRVPAVDRRALGTPGRIRSRAVARPTERQLEDRDNAMIRRGDDHRLLEQRLRTMLVRLEENTLLQFRYSILPLKKTRNADSDKSSWNVGDFIPSFVLGTDGYLPTRQCKLRTLCLDTPMLASSADLLFRSIYELTKLKSLANLSWKTVSGRKQRKALREFLRSSCRILMSLSLEIEPLKPYHLPGIHKILSSSGSLEVTPSGSNVADLSSPPYRTVYARLPLLQVLSLTGVSFEPEYEVTEMLLALNISHLRSLQLRECNGTADLLHAAVQLGLPMNLASLELNIDDKTQGPLCGHSALISFLEAFRGLRNLYLKIRPVRPMEHYWLSIAAHHKQSLKRFVIVERDEDRTSGFLQSSSADSHPLGLQCLGLYAVPPAIKRTLLCAQLCTTLQVLHIRLAEEEPLARLSNFIRNALEPAEELQSDSWAFFKFANWAFDGGLPNLRVLALGNFTNPESKKGHLLLARHDINIAPPSNRSRNMKGVPVLPFFIAAQDQTVFEATTEDDEGIFTNISDPVSFLGSCP